MASKLFTSIVATLCRSVVGYTGLRRETGGCGADGGDACPRRHAFVRSLPRRVQAAVANACMRFAAMAAFRSEERLVRKVAAHLHHRCGAVLLPRLGGAPRRAVVVHGPQSRVGTGPHVRGAAVSFGASLVLLVAVVSLALLALRPCIWALPTQSCPVTKLREHCAASQCLHGRWFMPGLHGQEFPPPPHGACGCMWLPGVSVVRGQVHACVRPPSLRVWDNHCASDRSGPTHAPDSGAPPQHGCPLRCGIRHPCTHVAAVSWCSPAPGGRQALQPPQRRVLAVLC